MEEKNCKYLLGSLSDYVDGELSAAERVDCEAHLAECADCRVAAAEFRQVIDIDLNGPFICAKAVLPSMMKRNRGKIINICSMMSELGRNTVSAYASAKGGLKMLTRNMATEWAKYNINVNAVAPGIMLTEPVKRQVATSQAVPTPSVPASRPTSTIRTPATRDRVWRARTLNAPTPIPTTSSAGIVPKPKSSIPNAPAPALPVEAATSSEL